MYAGAFPIQGDGREIDPIEGIVFYHGIVRHIAKHQFITGLQRGGERIIADDVPCQAGGPS